MISVPKKLEKVKSVRAYVTSLERDNYNSKAKEHGFASLSKMIQTSLKLLIVTLETGVMSTVKIKDSAWNGWEPKKSVREIKNIQKTSGHGIVMKEMKKILMSDTGYVYKVHSNDKLNILTKEDAEIKAQLMYKKIMKKHEKEDIPRSK